MTIVSKSFGILGEKFSFCSHSKIDLIYIFLNLFKFNFFIFEFKIKKIHLNNKFKKHKLDFKKLHRKLLKI